VEEAGSSILQTYNLGAKMYQVEHGGVLFFNKRLTKKDNQAFHKIIGHEDAGGLYSGLGFIGCKKASIGVEWDGMQQVRHFGKIIRSFIRQMQKINSHFTISGVIISQGAVIDDREYLFVKENEIHCYPSIEPGTMVTCPICARQYLGKAIMVMQEEIKEK